MSTGPAGGGYHTSEDEKILHRTRLRPGAVSRDGRLPELRDQLHDHLDPRRLPDVVLHRVQQRRPDRNHLGLAPRRPDVDDRRARDGGDRLRVPDRGWPLLLGLEARQPGVGLVHRLVQPRRPDRGHRGDRLRPRDLRDVASQPLVRLPEHEGVDAPHVHGGDAHCRAAEHGRRSASPRCSTRSPPTGTWPASRSSCSC